MILQWPKLSNRCAKCFSTHEIATHTKHSGNNYLLVYRTYSIQTKDGETYECFTSGYRYRSDCLGAHLNSTCRVYDTWSGVFLRRDGSFQKYARHVDAKLFCNGINQRDLGSRRIQFGLWRQRSIHRQPRLHLHERSRQDCGTAWIHG